jgi:hypothetical protein
MALALLAVGHLWITSRATDPAPAQPVWRRILAAVVLIAVLTQLAGLISVVLWGGFNVSLGPVSIRATTAARLLLQVTIAFAALLALSARARAHTRRFLGSPVAFYAFMTLLAMWLSLGPLPRTAGGDVLIAGSSLYGWLYDHVPGFTGVRVPARYAMIAGLFLAITAGYGCAILARAFAGTRLVAVVATLCLVESAAIPLGVNLIWSQREQMPPSRLLPASQAPAVYRHVAALPRGTVVAEFPFGDGAWEIRYVYYSTVHWKPILNGYSGSTPPGYAARLIRLRRTSQDPDAAWRALREAGTTHVILHLQAFAYPAEAAGTHVWLNAHGARRIESFPEGDVLYSLADAQ